MKKMLLIANKEWKVFFRTPFAVVILPLFLLITGLYAFSSIDSYLSLLNSGDAAFTVKGLSVSQHILSPYFKNLVNIFIMLIPLVTMRSFSEERRTGTYDLLISYPLRSYEILLGKFLGVFSFNMFLLFLTSPLVILCLVYGQPHIPQILTTYFGMGLFIFFYTAMGVAASLLTENQFVSALLAYLGYFVTLFFSWLAFMSKAPWDKFFANFLLTNHIDSFRAGLVYVGDVVVYLALTIFVLACALRKLERHSTR